LLPALPVWLRMTNPDSKENISERRKDAGNNLEVQETTVQLALSSKKK